MNIIVTGARGFIGSIFCRRATERGHRILALDDESRGRNILAGHVEKYVQHDCSGGISETVGRVGWWEHAKGVSDSFTGRVDAVVHLAAGTGSLDRPYAELVGLNVTMTQRVYHDAVQMGAKAFVFPTTSLGLAEDLKDSPYVKSKDDAMAWLLAEDDPWRQGGTVSNILQRTGIAIPVRFFNVTGAYKGASEFRQKEVHIIPKLVDAYREGRPFVINGDDYPTPDGTPGRDFINVLDLVEYLLFLIGRRVEGDLQNSVQPAPDGAIHCGTGFQTSALRAVRLFNQHIGGLKHTIGPRRAYDTGGLQIDGSQAVQYCRGLPGGLPTPFWVSLRDEAKALLHGPRA